MSLFKQKIQLSKKCIQLDRKFLSLLEGSEIIFFQSQFLKIFQLMVVVQCHFFWRVLIFFTYIGQWLCKLIKSVCIGQWKPSFINIFYTESIPSFINEFLLKTKKLRIRSVVGELQRHSLVVVETTVEVEVVFFNLL